MIDNTSLISETGTSTKPEDQKGFKTWRLFTITLIAFCDIIVFFQRAVPSIVSEPMAESYGVPTNDLSIFSSMFFYPYAIIQPFAGLLADVMDPRFLIGTCSLMAAVGSLMCGLSKTLFVGCIGRLLVGIGSGPIYVSACRSCANWFSLDQYSRSVGVFCAFAGCGGLIAQGPFSIVADLLGWRWCFFLVSIFGFVASTLTLIFVRGNPIAWGYSPVNSETANNTSTMSMKEKMKQLGRNFITVIKNFSFWMVGLYNLGINGPFFNINGMWGGPYLKDVYGYSIVQMGNIMMAISIGNVVGALVIPFVAELFNTRKWVVFWSSLIATLCLVPFVILENIPTVAIVALFFTYAVFSNSMTNVAYPMCREYFHASVAGSAVGCNNLYAYISTIAYQIGTGKWLAKYEIEENPGHYSPLGYKIALWALSVASSVFGTFVIIFADDTRGKKAKKYSPLNGEGNPSVSINGLQSVNLLASGANYESLDGKELAPTLPIISTLE
ncbi:transporter [Tritrichomonas foetus]|uniref:Lysosomal dipeptide transporter MFSD1 n=1 Tax=Tritrichomonas foetus TaxID=1144522 RepID=A0A1J4JZR6_9EUKA|nr:transporter [Tritrichomonas foetus]|eukprot:OHT03028.1 transporter [Tritrichomonas foetus]